MDFMLSTSDNPFNPVTDYDEWRNWDCRHGYYTMELLARFYYHSDNLSDAENALAYDLAIDTVINEIPTGSDARWILVEVLGEGIGGV